MDDWSLLKTYSEEGDERAFTQLVERHLGLVFHAAFRHLNDRSAAEEIAQAVFSDLAAAAGKLKPYGSLAAWLYRVACNKAVDFYRNESARKRREQQHAATMAEPIDESDAEVQWPDIAPLLDEAMQSLTEEQRTAILMRVFEERPLSEVGEALGIGEDGARKRVARALDRLRLWFERRGLSCHSNHLSLAIGAFAAAPLAAELIQSTAQAALKHGATVGITSTSTSTLLTLTYMKMPLILGLIAGAAVPISLGLLASPVTSPPPEKIASQPGPNFDLPDAETSDLMAEWISLREEYGPDAGSMPDLYKAIATISNDFRRRSFHTALLAEWVESNPTSALAFFKGENDQRQIENVLTLWIKDDPKRAITAMKNGSDSVQEVIGDLLVEVAKISPSDLADLAALVETQPHSDTRIHDAFTLAARNDLDFTMEAAMNLEGTPRKEALTGVARAWGEKDGPAAMEWLDRLDPSEDQAEVLQAILIGWAKSAPSEALNQLLSGDKSVISDRAAAYVFQAAEASDLDAALDWLAVNPDTLNANHYFPNGGTLEKRFLNDVPGTLKMICEHPATQFLSSAIHSIILNNGSSRTDEVWEWLHAQPPSEIITSMKESVFWGGNDLNKQFEWLSTFLNDSSITDNDISDVANQLVVNRTDPASFEDLMKRTPAELHVEFLKAGFREVLDQDVPYWIEKLNELPIHDRPEAINSLASVRARTDPVGAIAWANTYSAAERSAAYRGIVKTWAEADSRSASQWIAELPAVPERDVAATALVEAIAKDQPESAWIWAQTIKVPDQRSKALLAALEPFGEDTALIIEESNLSEFEKHALLKRANNNIQNPPSQ